MSQDFAKITRLVDGVAYDLRNALGAVAALAGVTDPALRRAGEDEVDRHLAAHRQCLFALVCEVAGGAAYASPKPEPTPQPAAPAAKVPEPTAAQREEQRVLHAADRAGFDVGLYAKFRIERTDGSSRPGGKHERCRYFVLDFDHDTYAGPAARAYADACQERFPALADDLRRLAGVVEERAAPAPDVVAQCRAALDSSLWEDAEAALRAVVAAGMRGSVAETEFGPIAAVEEPVNVLAERDLEVARLQGLVDSLSAELAVASEAVVAYEQMRLAGIREIETLAPMWATRLREAFKAPTSPRPTTEGAR